MRVSFATLVTSATCDTQFAAVTRLVMRTRPPVQTVAAPCAAGEPTQMQPERRAPLGHRHRNRRRAGAQAALSPRSHGTPAAEPDSYRNRCAHSPEHSYLCPPGDFGARTALSLRGCWSDSDSDHRQLCGIWPDRGRTIDAAACASGTYIGRATTSIASLRPHQRQTTSSSRCSCTVVFSTSCSPGRSKCQYSVTRADKVTSKRVRFPHPAHRNRSPAVGRRSPWSVG